MAACICVVDATPCAVRSVRMNCDGPDPLGRLVDVGERLKGDTARASLPGS